MSHSNEVWTGILLIIATFAIGAFLYHLGVIANLLSTVEQIVATVLAAMIIGGVGLIYAGRKSEHKIVVTAAKIDSEQFRAFHVEFRDGWREIPARFYFITVKNAKGPSVKDMAVHFEATYLKTPNFKMPLFITVHF